MVAFLGLAAIIVDAPPAEGRKTSVKRLAAQEPGRASMSLPRYPAAGWTSTAVPTWEEPDTTTGSTGSAGDTWLTDDTPDTPDQTIFTGSVSLSADVLIHPFNNKKGPV